MTAPQAERMLIAAEEKNTSTIAEKYLEDDNDSDRRGGAGTAQQQAHCPDRRVRCDVAVPHCRITHVHSHHAHYLNELTTCHAFDLIYQQDL
ncbi:hypothetical protein P171DRAFT_265380 [Karstenula rhodostoma CBS 690.94]|uniref:Uncharacterized protein n=1 Tax=Karstenula rhodostoma CBS 690.94 TaxID=1392251 RepID=A0A9P4UBB9_9PLEO|nr:hypothetical protein P171DRAFT_265380 [Karstenula rhodostoma CBS 690.94]